MCLSTEKDMVVVGNAYHHENAFILMKSIQPSVVLVDIDTIHADAILLARAFLRDYPGIKLIFLSLHVDQPTCALALSSGVAAIIGKTWSTAALIDTIRQVSVA